MHSKKIRASIAGILFILLCVLAGMLYYARDAWNRSKDDYKWQLSHGVREVFSERGSRNYDNFKSATDLLIAGFTQRYSKDIDSNTLTPQVLRQLINKHKDICREYFPGMDSVKLNTYQNGLDTTFSLQLELVRFGLRDDHYHKLLYRFDSLLDKDRDLRIIIRGETDSLKNINARSIKISDDCFSAEYRTIVVPYHLNYAVFKRFMPLLVFLVLCFLTISFFSFFSIRTILQQKKLSDQKTDFINNITHEFNTPLATIAVAVKTLQSSAAPPDIQRIRSVSSIIERQNSRLQEMINAIIPFSQEASFTANDQPLQVKAETEKILHDFIIQHKDTLQPSQLQQQIAIPETAAIRITSAVFATILLNILDNALKYRKPDTPASIRVHAYLHHQYLCMDITDNGTGIKKYQLKYIFDKFYRAQPGDVHNIKGMGLGLYFVKKSMTDVKGKVFVESVWGKGTTFRLQFPLAGK